MNRRTNLFKLLPVTIFVAILGVASVMPGQQVSAYTSAAAINSVLPGGQSTIVAVESQAQALNASCPNNRNGLNNCGYPYFPKIWISHRGEPASGEQYTLPSTTQTVPLQLNSFFFLTAATTGRNVGSTYGLGTIHYTSGSAPNMVTNGNYPNDRLPASAPSVNTASVKAYRYKIYSASVVAGGGSVSDVPVGSVYGQTINSSSRYSIGSALNFTYNSGAWTGLERKVTVRFNVANINTFHASPPGGTSQCYRNGSVITVGSNEFDKCSRSNVDYTFTFYIVPVWNLNPAISLNGTSSAYAGQTITTTPTVKNTAEGVSSGTNWVVSSMTYPSGSTPPAAVATSDNYGQSSANLGRPCAYFTSVGAGNCKTEASGTNDFKPGDNSLSNIDSVVGNYPLGTKVCYTLSVWSKDNTDLKKSNWLWAHSKPECVVLGKMPKVQVWGGDLVTGLAFSGGKSSTSNVTTSTTKIAMGSDSRIFGSWVEYGIFATGSISGAGSKSAFSGDGLVAGSPGDQCLYSVLSFTNVDPGSALCTKIGSYVSAQSIPDVGASFTSIKAALGKDASINFATDNLSGIYSATGNVSITGGGPSGVVKKGNYIVINAPSADVTISGDIRYTTDTMNSITDIPQVIIIAKTINITNTVTNIDAWLIASDQINTCSSVSESTPLTINVCNNPLVVNGPVMTSKLLLRRTAGSGTGAASGDPAEVFNLRADAYLWSAARSMDLGKVQTVYSTELPPRF